jgi:hypothetical protein
VTDSPIRTKLQGETMQPPLAHLKTSGTLGLVRRIVFCLSALALLVACTAQTVDLGSNKAPVAEPPQEDASLPVEDGGPAFEGCPNLSNAQIAATRGNGCDTATCNQGAADAVQRITTANDVLTELVGAWRFCTNTLIAQIGTGGPAQRVVGIEFVQGCRAFALVLDQDQKLVRGTELGDQSSFDIVLIRGQEPKVDIHLPDNRTVRMSIKSSHCPNNWLRLVSEDGRSMIMRSDVTNGGPPAR